MKHTKKNEQILIIAIDEILSEVDYKQTNYHHPLAIVNAVHF